MSIEKLMEELIFAIHSNTEALLAKKGTSAEVEPEGKANKAARIKAEKIAKAKAAKAGGTKGGKKAPTPVTIKAQAQKIVEATSDPKDCLAQIRVLVEETAKTCLDDATIPLDNFSEAALIVIKEELDKFEYAPTPPEEEAGSIDL